MKRKILALFFLAGAAGGCALVPEPRLVGPQSEQRILERATAGPLEVKRAQLITDNDVAFRRKLSLVKYARQSIDMMYYIYADDHSSSVLTKALIDAARRGVAVRLLVDYATNYKRLDLYSMMEKLGNEGRGSLRVRFYNRPTKNIIQDAVYMTMGCGREVVPSPPEHCSAEKLAAIEKLFSEDAARSSSLPGNNVTNLNIGNSGLFLSGLYARRADLMAIAVQEGQAIDIDALRGRKPSASLEDRQNLKKLARTYWRSRVGSPFQRLEAKLALFFAFSLYGEKLDPLHNTFTALLPAEKDFTHENVQDWNHISDYLHHKLLLVDQSQLQMGGRNVENSYHMRPNPLIEKYIFMDTDLYVEVGRGVEAIAGSFDALWTFDAMVATLEEVRQHAPNDFAANLDAYRDAEKTCRGVSAPEARETCTDKEFNARFRELGRRITQLQQEMEEKARLYQTQYTPTIPEAGTQTFDVEGNAFFAYLENLPYDRSLPGVERHRIYGASVGREAKDGKYIHDIWIKLLPQICEIAGKENPKQVILHNAYFFPPGNFVHALSRMINGEYDCSSVTVTVLTNSIQTTDLSPVNLAARHSLKAFAEFYEKYSDPARRATFRYHAYQPTPGRTTLSLHSKISVIGDDLLIGSANADVRSFMMDSNNAMLIRGAGRANEAYAAHLERLITDSRITIRLNEYLVSASREQMLQEDLMTFMHLMAKYRVDERLTAQQIKAAEARFVELLEEAYAFTQGIIGGETSASQKRELQNRFNELFKAL